MHITSKFETPCNDCGELIGVGEQADWIKGQKGVWCLSCHTTSTPLPGGPRRGARHAPPNGGDTASLLTTAPLIAAMTSLEAAIVQLTVVLRKEAPAKEPVLAPRDYRI